MSTLNQNLLDDWGSPEVIAEENPDFPVATLRYLARADIRRTNGFDKCVRFLSPRRFLISRSRLAEWLDDQVDGGTA